MCPDPALINVNPLFILCVGSDRFPCLGYSEVQNNSPPVKLLSTKKASFLLRDLQHQATIKESVSRITGLPLLVNIRRGGEGLDRAGVVLNSLLILFMVIR